jgi:predicted DNA-binding protein
MSTKRLEIRLGDKDRRQLDMIADSIGASRASAVRFLIRQWVTERNDRQFAVQTPIPHPRL